MKSAFILLLLAMPAAAVTPTPAFREGDVVTAGAQPACAVDPPPPPDFAIELHGRDAAPVRVVSTDVITAMTYSAAMKGIVVAHSTTTGQILDLLGSNGGFVPLTKNGLPPNAFIEALTPLGTNLLAVTYTGSVQPELWLFDADGSVKEQFALPAAEHYIQSIDVAADGCTMFYTTTQSIERFDVCARRSLSTFAHLYASAVRVLPDGGALAASGRQLVRLDAHGNDVGSFAVISAGSNEAIGAITLDQNPSLVWLLTTYGCNPGAAHVTQISIATGAVVAGPAPNLKSAGFAIAVQGEWHAAIDKPSAPRRRAVR